jgi:hypothetical protein
MGKLLLAVSSVLAAIIFTHAADPGQPFQLQFCKFTNFTVKIQYTSSSGQLLNETGLQKFEGEATLMQDVVIDFHNWTLAHSSNKSSPADREVKLTTVERKTSQATAIEDFKNKLEKEAPGVYSLNRNVTKTNQTDSPNAENCNCTTFNVTMKSGSGSAKMQMQPVSFALFPTISLILFAVVSEL